MNGTERKTDKDLGSRDGATDTSAIRDKRKNSHQKNNKIMTQITYNSWSKYDLALMFTLLTLIDSRLAELETENARLVQLRDLLHASLGRYDTAYKQSTKSFLTETIDTKDTARDKLTMVIEWVARYWMKLPDEEDAVRGRRVYQPFKDLTVSLPVTTRPFMLAA